jgi:hypothetical protein
MKSKYMDGHADFQLTGDSLNEMLVLPTFDLYTDIDIINKRIFFVKRDEVCGQFQILHHKKFCDVHLILPGK